MRHKIEEEEKEEEEMNNIRNKNGLTNSEKRMRKIGFKERTTSRELVKNHFFHPWSGRCAGKNLKSQKVIQKEIKFR